MSDIKTAEGIGKEIISHLSEHNEQYSMDDAEYIPLIKRIIEAIDSYVGNSSNSTSDSAKLKQKLLAHAKGLYIETCLLHAEENGEDISPEECKDESEEFFDYIYKHEEYPD